MPWTCPVCAAKISERRRHEVAYAMKQAEVLGLRVVLVTLTVPHALGDDVAYIVDRMSSAWTRLWQGRRGQELRLTLGIWGHIRALEVTHGANGFHPHFHALVFFHPEQQRDGRGGTCLQVPPAIPFRFGGCSPNVGSRPLFALDCLSQGLCTGAVSMTARGPRNTLQKGCGGLSPKSRRDTLRKAVKEAARRSIYPGLHQGRQTGRSALAYLCWFFQAVASSTGRTA